MSSTGAQLETARRHLNAWLEAELQLTTSQSYTIGSRSLKRADLAEVREQIKYWTKQVAMLESAVKRGGRNRIIRAVPRDL